MALLAIALLVGTVSVVTGWITVGYLFPAADSPKRKDL